MRPFLATAPALTNHVVRGVGARTQEQVRWIAARRVVAVMANEQVCRVNAKRDHVCNPVREKA
jgi:hypothetical protein